MPGNEDTQVIRIESKAIALASRKKVLKAATDTLGFEPNKGQLVAFLMRLGMNTLMGG